MREKELFWREEHVKAASGLPRPQWLSTQFVFSGQTSVPVWDWRRKLACLLITRHTHTHTHTHTWLRNVGVKTWNKGTSLISSTSVIETPHSLIFLKANFLLYFEFRQMDLGKIIPSKGHPRWLSDKESSCQWSRHRRLEFDHWEDLLEKEMTICSSIPAWGIPWTEEPGGLQSVRSQRTENRTGLNTHTHTHTHTLTYSLWGGC